MEKNMRLFLYAGTAAVLILLLYNLLTIYSIKGSVEGKINELRDSLRQPRVSITVIRTENCPNCFNIDAVLSAVEKSDVNITEKNYLDMSSDEAVSLIKKHGIKKLPAIILEGEIDRIGALDGFEKSGNAYVFTASAPPYVDAAGGNVLGLVSAVIVKDSNCSVCYDFNLVLSNLKSNGVAYSKIDEVEFNSEQGKQLIKKYNISRVPALLLSTDVDEYAALSQNLRNAGYSPLNGSYVFESPVPYINASTSKLIGAVNATYIYDSSCGECYNVSLHKSILERNLGVALTSEYYADANDSEGAAIVQKYNIEAIPTVVLSGDLDKYAALNSIWSQIGSIEEDGSYVFRALNLLGPGIVYKNLSSGQIVENPAQ